MTLYSRFDLEYDASSHSNTSACVSGTGLNERERHLKLFIEAPKLWFGPFRKFTLF